LLHHEKKAFFKFFSIYFISVALLILAVGFLYFEQMKGHLLKSEEFSIIEYARHIKMDESIKKFGPQYRHELIQAKIKHIDMRNFSATQEEFIKFIPMKGAKNYLQIFKLKNSYDNSLKELKMRIILVQVLLLLLFAYISYRLAKNALKPLQESIQTLDKFAKDLIHDLNTPVTSIKLNIKLLEKNKELKNHSAILRLSKSAHTISELHENLTILLQEETFQIQTLNLCEIVDDVVQTQKQIFPSISFHVKCTSFKVKLNYNAMKQILQNIISNACKYNTNNGYVKIYSKNNVLYIEDNGKGIKEPEKIFERSYSAENSSGIGLDIVKRLSNTMGITIEVVSNEKGTTFKLNMKI